MPSQAQIINGRRMAEKIRYSLKNKIAKLKKKPGLAIIMVGKNQASEVYVRLKEKAAQEVGINFRKYLLPAKTKLIYKLIKKLNKDNKIHGIVVQFPLPKNLDADKVVEAIKPEKDVDGFHPANVALLEAGRPRIIPGVLAGIIKLLEITRVSFKNKKCIILSNCQIFAEPLEFLLRQKKLKAKIIYPPFRDIKKSLKQADVVISAIGRPRFIKGEMIKSGSILVDVGFSRIKGKAVGDFDFASCAKKASYITPVPGGVGPMTVAMLLFNVFLLYKKAFMSSPMPKNRYTQFKFCPKCGHKLALRKIHGRKRFICQNKKCQFILYQNSKPTASAIIIKNNKVLLTKRAVEPLKGYWDAPGGFLEQEEHPEAGLRREMKEELGVSVKIIKLLGIYMGEYLEKHPESTLNIYYLAKITKGKIRPADDITEARWFDKKEIPKNLAFKNNREAIRDWKKLIM